MPTGLPSPYASDHSLRYVLGAAAFISIAAGVASYWRYAGSEAWVAEGMKDLSARGATLDTEGCIDAVLEWYGGCEEHNANAAVCEQGVKLILFHCLQGRDRSEECQPYVDTPDAGKWVYESCIERDAACRSKRECACAEAYRGVNSYCRTGQQAVQL